MISNLSMPNITTIHITDPEPYLETQGWFIEQYVRDPGYAYWDEPYQIALFTHDYTPCFTDHFDAIPPASLWGTQPLKVSRDGECLAVEEACFAFPNPPIYRGCVVWIAHPQPVLIFHATQGFPYRGPVRLTFDCAHLAAQIQHAAGDAQCVRTLLDQAWLRNTAPSPVKPERSWKRWLWMASAGCLLLGMPMHDARRTQTPVMLCDEGPGGEDALGGPSSAMRS